MATRVRYVWKDNILKLLRAGNTLTHAASVSGVAGHILSQEMNMDPEFKREIDEIRAK